MPNDRVFAMSFASVYPHYVNKAEGKGRTNEEVDECIRWLTERLQNAVRSRGDAWCQK